MSDNIFIINASIVNEGKIYRADVNIKNGIIYNIVPHSTKKNDRFRHPYITFSKVIDATGLYLIPGVIDTHVHFRDPGLTHKADIYTESKAAIAGGVTSFMDMPNTIPNTLTVAHLADKVKEASKKSLANYSFYMGASNSNIEEILKLNPRQICGLKVFMGSSTGNMLVDDNDTLNRLFKIKNLLIAVHCEDEQIIKNNIDFYRHKYGDDLPIEYHPKIRSREACTKATLRAIYLAKKHKTRLHILHVSTADELAFFNNKKTLKEKHITTEVCVNHLIFNKADYKRYGRLIKCNPAIKNKSDQMALMKAVNNNLIDVISTDHAPHTYEEKQQTYFKSASGSPMIQHSLPAILELYHKKKISLQKIVDKMCHAPADCFKIEKRGYIREGYYADLVLLNLNIPWMITYDNILYKCKWSPLMGELFNSKITHTFVNGHLVYENGSFYEENKGERLSFSVF